MKSTSSSPCSSSSAGRCSRARRQSNRAPVTPTAATLRSPTTSVAMANNRSKRSSTRGGLSSSSRTIHSSSVATRNAARQALGDAAGCAGVVVRRDVGRTVVLAAEVRHRRFVDGVGRVVDDEQVVDRSGLLAETAEVSLEVIRPAIGDEYPEEPRRRALIRSARHVGQRRRNHGFALPIERGNRGTSLLQSGASWRSKTWRVGRRAE